MIKQNLEKTACFRCVENIAIKDKVYCKQCMEDIKRYEHLQKLKEDSQY